MTVPVVSRRSQSDLLNQRMSQSDLLNQRMSQSDLLNQRKWRAAGRSLG
jgi:hypothetical protein